MVQYEHTTINTDFLDSTANNRQREVYVFGSGVRATSHSLWSPTRAIVSGDLGEAICHKRSPLTTPVRHYYWTP